MTHRLHIIAASRSQVSRSQVSRSQVSRSQVSRSQGCHLAAPRLTDVMGEL
jgi:hypothetical protein